MAKYKTVKPTCQTDVAAQFKVLDGLLFAPSEAMYDATRKSPSISRQEFDHFDVRVSFVQKKRLLQITGEFNLFGVQVRCIENCIGLP